MASIVPSRTLTQSLFTAVIRFRVTSRTEARGRLSVLADVCIVDYSSLPKLFPMPASAAESDAFNCSPGVSRSDDSLSPHRNPSFLIEENIEIDRREASRHGLTRRSLHPSPPKRCCHRESSSPENKIQLSPRRPNSMTLSPRKFRLYTLMSPFRTNSSLHETGCRSFEHPTMVCHEYTDVTQRGYDPPSETRGATPSGIIGYR